MNIIELARKAGGADITSHGWASWVGTQSTEFLERFAALVRSEVLAEPVKQEPVAWRWRDIDGLETIQSVKPYHEAEPLYAAPVDAKVIRAEALEEAAKWFETYKPTLGSMDEALATAIRRLK